ncbi:MAG: helix-turn-helix domain-containing protein [bacterium]
MNKGNRKSNQSLNTGIAQKIKQIRNSIGMSLQELSRKTGLSMTFLSRLENDKANISILNLRAVANALGVPIASLFSDDRQSQIKVSRAGQRRKMILMVFKGKKVTEEWLLSDSSAKLEPAVVSLPPGTNGGPPFSHEGEEFVWVLKGNVRFHLGAEVFNLEQGDSLYYPATIPHQFFNDTGKKALLLFVATPWSF